MKIDCLSNLHKCGASCCKSVTFFTRGDDEMVDYWEAHGMKVVPHPIPGHFMVVVPITCQQLDEDTLTCKLWGKPERPEVCNRLDFGATEGYVLTEGCLLTCSRPD